MGESEEPLEEEIIGTGWDNRPILQQRPSVSSWGAGTTEGVSETSVKGECRKYKSFRRKRVFKLDGIRAK